MKKYGVALIGCGHIGEEHLKRIYSKENVRVEYVCDVDMQRAKTFQNRFCAAKAVNDSDMCIADDRVDIVIIAVYPSMHLALLKKCLAYHKHVICEKPIGKDLAEGEEFVRLVKAHPDSKVLIGHILRHNQTYQKAAELIHSGQIGRPIVMRMVQNHHTMDRQRYLRLIEETSPLIDCGVHYMDVMQWFTGEKITDVSAIGMRVDPDVPQEKYNYAIATVKLSGGSIGYYEAGWTNTISAEDVKEFVGPKGRIRIIYAKDRMRNSEEGDMIELYHYPEKVYETINIPCDRKPCGEQFDYLVRMIEEEIPAVPSIDEVNESFRAVLEADKMIRK